MSLKDTQSRVLARVWKAIAQTDLDVSALDKQTLEALVNLVTEASLLEVDDQMGQSEMESKQQSAGDLSVFDDRKEDVLWEGRPFLSISLHYTITDERIRVTEGVLGKSRENIELIRVQDVDYSQTFRERILNLGDINIRSHDPSHPTMQLKNVKEPEAVYEILRRAILAARKKHNFMYREEM
jgi:hypothetical protein